MIRLFNIYFPFRTVFLALSEALLIVGALLLAFLLRFRGDVELALVYDQGGGLKIAIASVVLILCMYYYDLYDTTVLHRLTDVLTRLVQVLGTTSVLLAGLYYVCPQLRLGRGPFTVWIILTGILLVAWRGLFRTINRSRRLSERVVLLGDGPMAVALCEEIESRPELGLNLLGYVDAPPIANGHLRTLPFLGQVEQLPNLVRLQHVSRIILAIKDRRGRLPVEMLLNLKGGGVVVQDGPDMFEAITGKVCLEWLRPSRLLFSDGFRVSRFVLLYKRTASVALSILGIILTAPIMLLTALAIRLDSRGPAIFRQERIGKSGKAFTIYKFRSMRVGADEGGTPRPATANDDRVTRVGRWLRRYRLDELPQLFNILRGDMYFIGPRPFVPNMERDLSERIPFYSQRWTIKPGATGWAQIRRGYCASLDDNAEKLGYDLFYVKNMSIGLDLLILFETVKILILGRGGR